MDIEELFKLKKENAQRILNEINEVNLQIERLNKIKQDLTVEAIENNGALKVLEELQK